LLRFFLSAPCDFGVFAGAFEATDFCATIVGL